MLIRVSRLKIPDETVRRIIVQASVISRGKRIAYEREEVKLICSPWFARIMGTVNVGVKPTDGCVTLSLGHRAQWQWRACIFRVHVKSIWSFDILGCHSVQSHPPVVARTATGSALLSAPPEFRLSRRNEEQLFSPTAASF